MIRRGLIAAAVLGSLAGPAHATVVVPTNVDDMAQRAKSVVRARVRTSASAWDDAHRRIHTLTVVEVLDVYAGPSLELATIRTLGGEVGSVGMKVSGSPRFVPGEEVVLFLDADRTDPERFVVMGLSQGKFVVDRSGTTPRAVPAAQGLVYAVRDGRGGLQVDPTARGPAPVDLADLEVRVRAALVPPTAPTPPIAPPTPAPTTPERGD